MPASSNIEEQQEDPKPKNDASSTSPRRNNSLASTILPPYNETPSTAPPPYQTVTKHYQSAGPSTRRQQQQQPATNPPSQSHTVSCGNPASTVMAVMGDANPSPSEPPQAKRNFTDRLRDVFGDDLWGTKPGDPSFHLNRGREGPGGAGTTSGHLNVQGVRLSDYGGFGRSRREK